MSCSWGCVLPVSALEVLLVSVALTTYSQRIPEAPPALLLAQVKQESGWKPAARSPVGAVGLTQFMPTTWRWVAVSNGLGVGDPLDPRDALLWQAVYMRTLEKNVRYADAPCDRWLFALSSYNGGEGWVRRRQAKSVYPKEYMTTSLINPGITADNQRENQEYPLRIYKGQSKYSEYGTLKCKNLL